MAASGQGKKKKTQWKQLETSKIINADVPRKPSSSWADESTNELDDTYDYGRRSDIKVNLPTAPRSARDAENDANIPHEPPFQAYLSNIAYDVTEEEVSQFFSDLRVVSVRVPRDDRSTNSKVRGYGYVEFEDRKSLIEALNRPDTTLRARRMRIEIAADKEEQNRGRGGQRDRGPNEPDRTLGDWRANPRSDPEPQSDRDGFRSGPKKDFGNDRGSGMFGDRDRRFRDDDRDRGFRSRDGDRPGYRDNRGGFGDRDRGVGFRDDRGFREGGFRDERGPRDTGSDRYERKGFDDRRQDDRRGEYGADRGTWRRDPEPRERERDVGPPPPDRGEPKTRTRLNLQPRSRPLEDKGGSSDEAPSAQPGAPAPAVASASIFGGARPVDTAAREREIEERLAKQREEQPPARDDRVSGPPPSAAREPAAPVSREDEPASPPLEPAPPPKDNVWARRTQQTNSSQVNNGSISPHEDGETHKHRHPSPSNEPRTYQPPRRNAPDDRRRDERGGPVRGGGAARGGGGLRHVDTRQPPPPKPREQKKDPSEETIRMPKVQEHQAPNFVGSNKYAFLEDSESAAD